MTGSRLAPRTGPLRSDRGGCRAGLPAGGVEEISRPNAPRAARYEESSSLPSAPHGYRPSQSPRSRSNVASLVGHSWTSYLMVKSASLMSSTVGSVTLVIRHPPHVRDGSPLHTVRAPRPRVQLHPEGWVWDALVRLNVIRDKLSHGLAPAHSTVFFCRTAMLGLTLNKRVPG
jgi:hypothetical protein